MRIDILTIFPEMFSGPLTESLIRKAREKKIININIIDIRSFSSDKHRTVDDKPFGGGPGMVLKPEPIYRALKSVGAGFSDKSSKWPKKNKTLVIYPSPQGQILNHNVAQKLSEYKHLVFICGHYEGIDERIMCWINQEISIGDYVLTGGELPAMVILDTVVRLIPGVVKQVDSIKRDSFYNGLLDYPHYTRPKKFKGKQTPKILLCGHHSNIEEWRHRQSLFNTLNKRPDILKRIKLNKSDKNIIKEIAREKKCR